eukprot:TRINITY_DN1628_c0_g1_i3.p1 TRINITY_DN1628_c0_g1~~TRINITY_DN1628_c0_g1_i3.p1  ORF type:complete len:405 (-),score=7.57 TRINITY_DN1628_c0_g1_i3:105-1277(-)
MKDNERKVHLILQDNQLKTLISNGTGLIMFDDNSTYITYVRKVNESAQSELGLKVYYPNGTFSDFVMIDSGKEYFHGALKASKDGSEIIVAQTAFRDASAPNPVRDVFVAYSRGGWNNWTNMVPVKRPNMNDTTQRYLPSIVYINETYPSCAFFIFSTSNGTSGIACMRFSPDRTQFFDEAIAYTSDDHKILAHSTAHTTEGGFTVHLAWILSNSSILYSYRHGGPIWSPPKVIGTNASNITPSIHLMTNQEAPSSYLYLTYIGADGFGYLLISPDKGQTWLEPVKLTNNTVDALSPALCGTQRSQSIFFLASFDKKVKFYEYNIPHERILQGKIALENKYLVRPHVACKVQPNSYLVKVLGTLYPNSTTYIAADEIPSPLQKPNHDLIG